MRLSFQLAKTQQDLRQVHAHNMSAFFDEDEFPWSFQWLEKMHHDGYSIYQVKCDGETIAALFTKKTKRGLLSKHTPIKLNFQGNGLSHQIKDYIETLATKAKCGDIFHYCAMDNFRMAALNESHDYRKTGQRDGNIVEWHKSLY